MDIGAGSQGLKIETSGMVSQPGILQASHRAFQLTEELPLVTCQWVILIKWYKMKPLNSRLNM